jgi:hypothetical protein
LLESKKAGKVGTAGMGLLRQRRCRTFGGRPPRKFVSVRFAYAAVA